MERPRYGSLALGVPPWIFSAKAQDWEWVRAVGGQALSGPFRFLRAFGCAAKQQSPLESCLSDWCVTISFFFCLQAISRICWTSQKRPFMKLFQACTENCTLKTWRSSRTCTASYAAITGAPTSTWKRPSMSSGHACWSGSSSWWIPSTISQMSTWTAWWNTRSSTNPLGKFPGTWRWRQPEPSSQHVPMHRAF